MSLLFTTLSPKTRSDAQRLSLGARRRAREDPSIAVTMDDETGMAQVATLGERHLEIVIDRLRDEFDVDASVSRPKVVYKGFDGVRCEPIMRVVIDVPSEHVVDVRRRLLARRGRIFSLQDCGGVDAIVAEAPLAAPFGFDDELRRQTSGRAAYRTAFVRFQPCPDEDGVREREGGPR